MKVVYYGSGGIIIRHYKEIMSRAAQLHITLMYADIPAIRHATRDFPLPEEGYIFMYDLIIV